MKYIIDRTKWMRGERNSLLLRDDGKMCCLGQIAIQCGATTEQIKRRPAPWNTEGIEWPSFIDDVEDGERQGSSYEATGDAMEINDCTVTSDAQKESALIELFAKHGHELTFIN